MKKKKQQQKIIISQHDAIRCDFIDVKISLILLIFTIFLNGHFHCNIHDDLKWFDEHIHTHTHTRMDRINIAMASKQTFPRLAETALEIDRWKERMRKWERERDSCCYRWQNNKHFINQFNYDGSSKMEMEMACALNG